MAGKRRAVMENPRTTAARDHDDSALLESDTPAPATSGTSGGNLARDIASQDEEAALTEPDATTRPQKQDDIHNDAARRTNRPR
jgi:hypothetical protein